MTVDIIGKWADDVLTGSRIPQVYTSVDSASSYGAKAAPRHWALLSEEADQCDILKIVFINIINVNLLTVFFVFLLWRLGRPALFPPLALSLLLLILLLLR